ncbi:hypothetical protein SDC9_139382 [bioreactor metagenome]|uniref:Uncharacterized protein n=1 Tax=bioreactor metagenome TaxID=1076179 RepID=A0A645DSE1_9ZZZZ
MQLPILINGKMKLEMNLGNKDIPYRMVQEMSDR